MSVTQPGVDERDAYLVAQRAEQPRWVELNGLRLWEGFNVFSPKIGFTSKLMGLAMRSPRFSRLGSLVEVGTGTAYIAIEAANAGIGEVVALDMDEAACACALYNVHRHGVQGKVRVVTSDLFTALGTPVRRFGGGVFNQPFYESQKGLMGLDHDMVELNRRFLTEAKCWVVQGGPILMAYSGIAGPKNGPNDPRPVALELGYTIEPVDSYIDTAWQNTEHEVFALLVP